MDLENIINKAWSNRDLLKDKLTINAVEKVIAKLDAGELRVASIVITSKLVLHNKSIICRSKTIWLVFFEKFIFLE